MALAWLTVLAALGSACSQGAVAPGKGMNVLFVTLDTTRADALSCYGADPGTTPNLDALAARGTRFEEAYSATNTTCPSHLSLLSGLRLIEHRVFENRQPMDPAIETLQDAFRRAGYRTAAFPAVPFLGTPFGWQGFDEIDHTDQHRTADAVRKSLLNWLRSGDRERPFFAWAHFYDPHTLYEPPPPIARQFYRGDPYAGDQPLIQEELFLQRWDYPALHEWIEGVRDRRWPRAMYDAEVHFVDRQIGHVLDFLAEQGLDEDTIVVVTADHGESFGEHGIWYAHSGLFETSVRVPFIVRVPGLEPRVERDVPISALDLAPSLAELCDVPWPAVGAGESFVPLLRGPRGDSPIERRDTLVVESANNALIAVRRGRWKLIWPISDTFQRVDHEPSLYDLESDPDETRNLYREEPEIVRELRAVAEPWIELGVARSDGGRPMSDEILEQLEALGYGR